MELKYSGRANISRDKSKSFILSENLASLQCKHCTENERRANLWWGDYVMNQNSVYNVNFPVYGSATPELTVKIRLLFASTMTVHVPICNESQAPDAGHSKDFETIIWNRKKKKKKKDRKKEEEIITRCNACVT